MGGSRFELLGYIRRQVSIREERLCIASGDEVELAAVVELADREQRLSVGRSTQRERAFELGTLRLGGPTAREQTMGVLTGHTELTGKVGDRESLPPQKRLPNVGFISHGDDGNQYPRELRE
jgi:hypothetical protein